MAGSAAWAGPVAETRTGPVTDRVTGQVRWSSAEVFPRGRPVDTDLDLVGLALNH